DDFVGQFPVPDLPFNTKSRALSLAAPQGDEAKTGVRGYVRYEITLDMFKELFAWGDLLLPKDLKPGERQPIALCHDADRDAARNARAGQDASGPLRGADLIASQLAAQRFVVFVVRGPEGTAGFSQAQRKAQALGKSIDAILIAQTERIVDWLSQIS